MRVFLTGASGFIGSFLAESLLEKGYQVRCLVRTSSNLRWLADLNVECFYGSLNDGDSLRRGIKDVDYIIHAAGLTRALSKEDYAKVNFRGSKNLIKTALESSPGLKRFVLVSSQAAAGPSSTLQPVTENSKPHPLTDYGKSKLLAENYTMQFKNELPLTIVRPPAVYGPRDKDTLQFFKAVKKGIIPQVDGKIKFLSIIYVKDLVDGIIRAMESEKAVGQTYFLANAEPYSWEEIARITLKILGKKGIRLNIPGFLIECVAVLSEGFSRLTLKASKINRQTVLDMKQDFWICSPRKAKADFNFEAKTPLSDGIRETLNWYRDNGWM